MPNRLADIGPVQCDNRQTGASWRTPNPNFFTNVPLMWQFLDLTLQDWAHAVAPFQTELDAATEGQILFHVARAFNKLQAVFLKSLFSYVFFFVALEKAYDELYVELNTLNREPVLRVPHRRPPQADSYLQKVRRIRNLSIAHLGSREARTARINVHAAMMWGPMSLGKSEAERWDLNMLTFNTGTLNYRDAAGNILAQSDDFEVQGIPELHQHCSQFLDEYDRVCSDYLTAIMAKLPCTAGGVEYASFQALLPSS